MCHMIFYINENPGCFRSFYGGERVGHEFSFPLIVRCIKQPNF
jgi:hypothetical protein